MRVNFCNFHTVYFGKTLDIQVFVRQSMGPFYIEYFHFLKGLVTCCMIGEHSVEITKIHSRIFQAHFVLNCIYNLFSRNFFKVGVFSFFHTVQNIVNVVSFENIWAQSIKLVSTRYLDKAFFSPYSLQTCISVFKYSISVSQIHLHELLSMSTSICMLE